ncbi:hypothetical protein [Massilia pseudoviolaceinigra]|uniref:hypothetical protein n=1 Tax=Massilia pseudoviolaceinigra TaxID=3057165 RepID=UPI0027963FA9|nr:hypothetical protein [Massilia sp. CCM 9206]MDQ1921530.1 hypothetical protein [Massilia sp. CCM 9206]
MTTSPDPVEALREQFQSEDGFLVELRCFARWDKAAFARLVAAMQRYLESAGHGEHLERWMAEGFWLHGDMVKVLSSPPEFRNALGKEYLDAAYQRLSDLACWFFTGASIWEENSLAPFEA